MIEALMAEHGLAEGRRAPCVPIRSPALRFRPARWRWPRRNATCRPSSIRSRRSSTGHGLIDEPITIRMSGCPNGCSRPYVAEIALTGRAPGKYNLYLGGGFHGERLATLYAENIGEDRILEILAAKFQAYSEARIDGESFGDFVVRVGGDKPS